MKNIIIGTAGHVDHGKTMLIKALTGIDTDRLAEEKKRGITIELGFAFLELPNGERAGIVDVPGHEKFVGNMLAGAGGIDLALLVVAADDGIMPQTREHLGILRLLGVNEGIIVITKADLVEPDWLELVTQDIRGEVKATPWESAPVIAVSAYTGQGIGELKDTIFKALDKASAKNTGGPFRIPVDRVFSVGGFGTVITGTLIEGSVAVGDEAELYPAGLRVRVRNLQVHSRDVEKACAGQRVAVNLAGIPKEEATRGNVLASPGSMQNTLMLDVKLRILPDSGRAVKNGARLHLYHGARELLCKVALLDADSLLPGQEGYAQLRLTEELAAKKGDRFVVRFYSPVETVGGGVVLDPDPPRRRRHSQKVLDALNVREHGSAAENLAQTIADGSPKLAPLSWVRSRTGRDGDAFRAELEKLVAAGQVFLLGDKVAIDKNYKDALARSAKQILGDYHRDNPLQAGMRRDELRSRLLPGRDANLADRALDMLAEDGVLSLDSQKAALAGFAVKYSADDKKLAEKVEAVFRGAGYAPPGVEEILAMFPKEGKAVKKVLEAMLASGALVSAAPQVYFHKEAMTGAREKISGFIAENGQITLAQFRDISGTSRKFALMLLEYFDRHGITKKVGDARVLAKKTR